VDFDRPDLWTDQPGTIDDLISDALARQFPATPRLVHDWVEIGLLDHPERRFRGGRGGSDKALWPWTQRNLFRLLVSKRPSVKSVATLCNVPVGLWLYYGVDYVPTHQVQVALATWAGRSVKVSWTTARRQARELTDFLDDLQATRDQRRDLIELLAPIGYNGPDAGFDVRKLDHAVREILDPGHNDRPVGAPGASMKSTDVSFLIASRARGLQFARDATIEELANVRECHLAALGAFSAQQRVFVSTAFRPQDAELLRQPLSPDRLLNGSCADVCTLLGLATVRRDDVGRATDTVAR
jgi:hypothetical protein